MFSRFSHHSIILALSCFALICCSCEYGDDFDALSSFPANPNKLPIEEIDLTPIDGYEPADLIRKVEAEIAPGGSEIQPGLISYPFRYSSSSSNRFERLSEIATSLASYNVATVSQEDAALLWSPFTATGIAIGDIDNDLLPEVFVADRNKGGRLFKNLGNMMFKDITAEWGILINAMWGSSPVFVDINDDGWLDLYLCGYDSRNLLYVNKGGKFREESRLYGLDIRSASTGANFIDYDRDGDLDLYLVTARLKQNSIMTDVPTEVGNDDIPRVKEELRERFHMIRMADGEYEMIQSGQYDRLYRNNNGMFEDVTEDSGIDLHPYRGVAAVWSDFNNDDWPDLYVANNFEDTDQVFMNRGSDRSGRVTFRETTTDALVQTPLFAKGVDSADFDNDGFFDLFVTGTLPDDRFSRATSSGHLFQPNNGERFMHAGEPRQVQSNSLLLNTRDGKFMDIAHACGLGSTDWTWSTRLEDFDNDGLVDILLACGKVRQFLDDDLNRGLATTNELKKRQFWWQKKRVGLRNRIFRNLGDLKFEEVSDSWGIAETVSLSQTLATADLDNDGDLDFVVGGFGEQTHIYRNNLPRGNAIRIQLVGVDSPRSGIGARIRLQVEPDGPIQSRMANPVRGFQSSSENIVHFGLGEATNVSMLEITWSDGVKQQFHDLRADFLYLVTEPGGDRASIVNEEENTKRSAPLFAGAPKPLVKPEKELGFDQSADQDLLPFSQSNLGPSLAWGDADGDGERDLFQGGAAFSKARLFMRQGTELKPTFNATFDADIRSEDLGAVFFDADMDGDLDLYTVSGGVEFRARDSQYNDRLYLNDGRGNFEKSSGLIPEATSSGSCVIAADFDGDQRIDLFVGGRVKPSDYPSSSPSQLLKNTENGFVDVADEYNPMLAKTGMVTAAVWADVNNDHWPDLMVAHEWGPVRFFRNVGGKSFVDDTQSAQLENINGLFHSLCAGDVDNDGDTDFFVGNLGTNSIYQASSSRPFRLFIAYINGSNRLFEAVVENDQWFPTRNYELVKRFIPDVTEQFRSVSDFARQPMPKILTDRLVGPTRTISVNELRSGLLINQSDGDQIRFDFVPLPTLAQVSPVFGCQLVDVNGDGNLDLYLLQNESDLFSHTETMHNGRSLLLTGDGTGKFRPLLPVESGLDVVGDGAALTCVDLNQDQRVDFVAATNDQGTRVFLNRGDFDPLSIDLGRFDREYIGAKVMLRFEDASEQLHQVFASSGYLSQSTPVIYSGRQKVSKIHVRWPDGTIQSGSVDDFTQSK